MEAETSFGEQNNAYSRESDNAREKGNRQRETSRRKKDSRYREREPRSRHPEQQERDPYGKGSGSLYCFLLITLIIAAVSTTGLILSIISFVEGDSGKLVEVRENKPNPTFGDEEFVPGPYNPDEVWLIQVGYDGSTLEYLDPILGQIKGYNIDVLNAVCRKANKNCRLVLDTYTRCWSGAYGGQALMDRWYHACTGWRITTEREYAVKFTDPFSQRTPGFLVTASGSSGFDWTDLRGKTIGFLGGWFTNAVCLNNQDGIQGLPLNNMISNDQTKVYPTVATLEAALVSGEVDAVFIDTVVDIINRHDISSPEFQCAKEGAGMVMRKDTQMDKWWNPAWRALLVSDEYQDICDDITLVHGNQPGPGQSELCRNRNEYESPVNAN